MNCPYCSFAETQVIDSRDQGAEVRRRRECLKCKKRFTTYEKVEVISIVVIKKDGSRQHFDKVKIKQGILKACEKRQVTNEQIDQVVESIEQKIKGMKSTEIASRTIGELVMNKLKQLDKVAYIRFASVYREFSDLQSFEEELHKLISQKQDRKKIR
ncbi:MAG: transcriptional regulator NrdR [Nanoarchaeota archaeon]